MKISHEQKEKNRQAIIEAAVELIIEKGYKAATMRGIARAAGLGDATIYNYFTTKESILYAYYEDKFQAATQSLQDIEGFAEYSFQEQLEVYFDAGLEGYLADREFLQETFRLVFYPMTPSLKLIQPMQTHYFAGLESIFDTAMEKGEIEPPLFLDLTKHFFWDYYIGIVFYWLKDASEHFSDTTSLINKTMDLACAVIKAGIVNKVFDIASFLFRHHILGRLHSVQDGVNAFSELKREFMGETDGQRDTGK